eukprot:snap_masked-scaffold475_size161908-processed-gene-0.5 protein:Tk07978 transcript:snap_masked-scaffold475_size161908-processed-gene-0.5-mRNA-1 annotation:"hypothetical protein DAPPUDRAFT_301203"
MGACGKTACFLVLLAPMVLVLFLNDRLFPEPSADHLRPAKKWFGPGQSGAEDPIIHPFKFSVGEQVIQDLHERLAKDIITLPKAIEGVGFEYGFNLDHLHEIADYWRTKFDWKIVEKRLNHLPQFKTRIDGLDIHFIHVKPAQQTHSKKVIPLLMAHGWPNTPMEFQKIIPLLSQAENSHADFVFELILPSIPGFGFSSASAKPGLDVIQTSRIFHELMLRVGHRQYYVQGGDWGAYITNAMAIFYPEHVLGYHTHFPMTTSTGSILKFALLTFFPSWVPPEQRHLVTNGTENVFGEMLMETGYFHVQATKPDTLGAALQTSPIGLMAWILEKYSTAGHRLHRHRPDGGLTETFALDELLENVMIYWVTGTITTSGRFYYENFQTGDNMALTAMPVRVPAGISLFPNEFAMMPEMVHTNRFRHLVSFNVMPRGGHFAYLEEPKMFADEIFAFVGKVEAQATKSGSDHEEL